MKPLSLLPAAIVILFSCNHPSGPGNANPVQLTENSIYNIDSVRAATAGGNEEAARKKMLQATDVYKNEKDPVKSIGLFKSSILLKPSGQAYFELGSALLDDSLDEEAISALHIAEQLDYSPLANVMYKLSLANAQLSENNNGESNHIANCHTLALHYMEVALQMGYSHPEQFRNNAIFVLLKNSYGWEFGEIYNSAISAGSGNKSPDKMLWETFASEFHPVELPLTINSVWIHDHKLENSIGYDYEKFVPEMRGSKFSREVSDEYYYFAAVKKDTGYTALIYAGKSDLSTDGSQQYPIFFYLVTYDKKGKIIDKIQVAGQKAFSDPFKVFTLQPNYTFEIRNFKNIYRDNPDTAGYDSNIVVKSEPLSAASYRIGANGKFEELDVPLAISFPPSRSGSAFPQ
jgi:hypothetical protein